MTNGYTECATTGTGYTYYTAPTVSFASVYPVAAAPTLKKPVMNLRTTYTYAQPSRIRPDRDQAG